MGDFSGTINLKSLELESLGVFLIGTSRYVRKIINIVHKAIQ